jgi:transposase
MHKPSQLKSSSTFSGWHTLRPGDYEFMCDDRPFCGTAPLAVAYFYSPDRGAHHPAADMASLTGMLQADGYAGFEKLHGPALTKPCPIVEFACWAHVRRGFFDEREHHKLPTTKQALNPIEEIHSVEARAGFVPLAERVEFRQQTAPLVDGFFTWTEAKTAKLSAKSSLARAFRYAINRREALSRVITDGRLELDNHIAENDMRGIAIGLKNYLFVDSASGRDRAAAIYTLVQTAKLNDVNPEPCLSDILAKFATAT